MKFLSCFIYFVLITNSFAQLKVGYVQYAFIDGNPLASGDSISVKNCISINKGGEIHLINKTGWGFYLYEGKYNLDSCYQLHRLEYTGYDSVKAMIDTIFPNGLKGRMRPNCSPASNGQDENYNAGNIAFLNTEHNSVMNVTADTVTIYWRDPQKNTGRYIIEFQNMFDDKIGYRIVRNTSLHVNVRDFPDSKDSSFLLVTVYSEDGRKSSKIAIQKK